MKRFSVITIVLVAAFVFAVMTPCVQGSMPKGEAFEYKVMSIDPKGWVVTAQQTATGNVVKFRLPPAVFKGQTFDADLGAMQKGQRFSVRGPRNARLDRLFLDKPLPPGTVRARGPRPKLGRRQSEPLAWEIMHVDPRRWIVTAKNRRTQKVAKFQAHPEAFTGFLFRANLRGIKKGEGFAIVTPNNQPMNNCCTLLEIK